MRVKVSVTENDIRRGLRNDASHCPVARALYRRFRVHGKGVAMLVDVGDGQLLLNRIYTDTDTITAVLHEDMPVSVQKFVDAFDAGRSVKPFTFSVHRL